MPPFRSPTVLMTRPREGSERFLNELRKEAGPFVSQINPAFHIESLSATVPHFDMAIFTSLAGVSFAPTGAGRTAWCVGQTTADAAANKGYDAISADGDVSDLVRLILNESPTGRLLHIRGEVVRGNVTADLLDAGLTCDEAVTYRKVHHGLQHETAAIIRAASTVLIPVFSAETVSIIGRWNVPYERAHLIAMSQTIAEAAKHIDLASIRVAQKPEMTSLVHATARLIA